ncbi:MAG TPA: ornithine cyclodeaminase family protein [Bryobacteraceae bacterium]|nr:ornithine cyclodeaminase family protein [Bryobacteraceae bacterium]
MLYLTEKDVRELLPMRDAIKLMAEAFDALKHGRAINEPRRRMLLNTGSGLHSMAAAYGDFFGTKIYSTHPKFGAYFHFILYNAQTAEPLAWMEANHLGQIRTGAATGYAADLLADPNAQTLGVIGSGFQARTQVEAIRAVRSIQKVRVWSRDDAKRRKFAEEVGAVIAGSAEEAVRGAQIVVTATSSPDPVVENDWIAPGTFVAAMGANRPTTRELPGDLVHRAGLVVTDSIEQAKIESGDLILADCWKNVHELHSVERHFDPTRVTIFKSLGICVEDVAAGAFVYERALTKGTKESGDLPTLRLRKF